MSHQQKMLQIGSRNVNKKLIQSQTKKTNFYCFKYWLPMSKIRKKVKSYFNTFSGQFSWLRQELEKSPCPSVSLSITSVKNCLTLLDLRLQFVFNWASSILQADSKLTSSDTSSRSSRCDSESAVIYQPVIYLVIKLSEPKIHRLVSLQMFDIFVWTLCRAGECPPSVYVSDDDGDSGSDIKMPLLWWSVMVTPVTGQGTHWITFKIQNIYTKFLFAIEEAFVPK